MSLTLHRKCILFIQNLLQSWPVDDSLVFALLSSLLQPHFEHLSALTADWAVFSMTAVSSPVCCLLVHRSCAHPLIKLITLNSFNASKSPLNSCKCDNNAFFCEKQKPSPSLIHCRKQHNPEFWCEPSLIIWSQGSNTTDSVVCFPFFFLFLRL